MDKIPFTIEHNGQQYQGYLRQMDHKQPPLIFHVVVDNAYCGNLVYSDGWVIDGHRHQELAEPLGEFVTAWWG